MIPLYDTLRTRRFPLVTLLLILVNVLVFLYESRLSPAGLQAFILDWGLIPQQLKDGPQAAWWTVFTSMFMHGGWFHILTNMWVLFIFGDNVEARLGGIPYLIFYLSSGIAAAALQIALLPASGIPVVGASGAIAGVLGAYMLLFPQSRVASLVPILFIFTLVEVPAFIYLAFWFVSQLFSGLLSFEGVDTSGIAWWAHVGGFVFGASASVIFPRRRSVSTRW
ncbi:MAG: rhomboid family intramembrane serine protease [Chloroflexi bacterium]|nr:rhomboid family intramembrane serine protease [Chloroflexota bacterium]